MYFVYILWSGKLKRYYTGTTDNTARRLKEHNDGIHNDAFSVKGIPWVIYLLIQCNSSIQAYAIEKHIKKMKSSAFIRNLKKYPKLVDKLITRYSG